MKKWIIAIVLLFGLGWIATCMIFPRELTIIESVKVGSSMGTSNRGLLQQENWPAWLDTGGPGESGEGAGRKPLLHFKVKNTFNRELRVQVMYGHEAFDSRVYILPELQDSVSVKWQCSMDAGMNPLRRWAHYRAATTLSQRMELALQRLKEILEDNVRIYGFPIEREIVKDTVLIATRADHRNAPGTAEVYALIGSLRKYIRQQHAAETGFPMVHTDSLDPGHFETMVAIPVNRHLPGGGQFIYRRMVAGYILAGEARGGEAAVRACYGAMENYISDNQKNRIANPFESYITDRIAQPDSAKWITRIYFPIVH